MMPEFEVEMKKAADRVESFDKCDGVRDRSLKAIAAALEAGLKQPDTGCQFDALWMLLDISRGGQPC